METDHLMAIVNEIELNITEEMIEGANHKKTEQMLDNIVKNSDYKFSKLNQILNLIDNKKIMSNNS